MNSGAAYAFVGVMLGVTALVVATAWEPEPRAAASVALTLPPKGAPPTSKNPTPAFDLQQAFADFHAKQLAATKLSQPGQPWSLNPPPGRKRPAIIDLNAQRTEL